jgi:hypothetical protein
MKTTRQSWQMLRAGQDGRMFLKVRANLFFIYFRKEIKYVMQY